MDTMTLLPDRPYSVDGSLTITVVEIVEKRLFPDKRSMMRITLRMQLAGQDATIEVTSDEPRFRWNGYEFEYAGGWRENVALRLIGKPQGK